MYALAEGERSTSILDWERRQLLRVGEQNGLLITFLKDGVQMNSAFEMEKPAWYRDVNDPEDKAWGRYSNSAHLQGASEDGDELIRRFAEMHGLDLSESDGDSDYNDDHESPDCECDLTKFQTEHSEYMCDGCEADVSAGADMYGCRDCDFDLCPECYSRRQRAVQQQQQQQAHAQQAQAAT
jgi:hypothetical protein